ncbi:hypothetical protein A2533_04710 [Candidatus Falkowbacteria bacterium RIFOXYD2_FULL_35_9]|uniref:Methyltransferase small domain-containing protein n=1 Tax=Candidatus Falkowbacteria bacterium RIFOXYC2_FULL_36_12 TaxID=1798002 RepID=A0A1F5T3S5_9BACT|nr:MAG: hypothetical protein A2478_01685 [Candidatus Falkowbacteria bacterium RIFOXYC2_FULL_36_12]OGF46074.1 MAG: hypothetical protein A2533_04710 [Candidatus Falkowbacteria bacterium RIFOXYD2_FULL_35_9]
MSIISKPSSVQINDEIRYQKKLINKFRSLSNKYSIKILDEKFIVYPKVFEPNLDSEILIKSLKHFKFTNFLEIGGGTGIVSIFASKYAKSGLVVDINKNAIKNIQDNINLHNLNKILTVNRGSLFDNVSQKYDLIIANLPFMKIKSEDVVASAFFDENLSTWSTFLSQASEYLTENGSILTVLPNFCAFDDILEMAKKNHFEYKIIDSLREDWREFTTFKLFKKSNKILVEQSKKIAIFLRINARKKNKYTYDTIKKPFYFYVDGYNGKLPVFIFSSFPCAKYCQGYCTPCLYSNITCSRAKKDEIYNSLIVQTQYIIDNFDNLITNKQTDAEHKNLHKIYPENKLVTAELCGEGSFLANPEIPSEFRKKIIDMFVEYSQKEKLNMQLFFESKISDFLEVYQEFEDQKDLIKKYNLTLLFGFEAVNDFTRQVLYNKGLQLRDFEKGIKKAQELGFRTGVFVFCGVHSMTQKEIIEDTKQTIEYCRKNNIAFYLMLPNLQPFTLNHLLFINNRYNLLDPRTVLEIIKILIADSDGTDSSYYLNGHNWSIGGLTTHPQPEMFLFQNKKNIACEKCSNRIKRMIYDLAKSYDTEKFMAEAKKLDTCKCKKDYIAFTEYEERNKETLRKRVEDNLTFAMVEKENYINTLL